MPIGDSNELTRLADFFRVPSSARQRQYKALRAFFREERPSAEAARAFGYSPGAFRVLCHHFRHDPSSRDFFRTAGIGRPPGVRRNDAVREEVIALRKNHYSVRDISAAFHERGIRVTPAAARDILREEGFAPLPRRFDEERLEHLGPAVQPVADVRAFSLAQREFVTACGGLFLFVPDLVRLDVLGVGERGWTSRIKVHSRVAFAALRGRAQALVRRAQEPCHAWPSPPTRDSHSLLG